MTLMELCGCALITFSPPVLMFIFTVAHNPIKIIILTCSAFFWLIALLFASVVWFALVPIRDVLEFGMFVSIVFQEGIRVLFYFIMKLAEEGLQKIALADEEGEDQDAAAGSGNNSDSGGGAAVGGGVSEDTATASTATDRIKLTAPQLRILHIHTLSYVCGLGFGFMSGAFAMVNLLADMSGPGSVGLKGEHVTFFLVSAFLAMFFILLNVCWTVITFVSIDEKRKAFLPFVWIGHLVCSGLTRFNSLDNPLFSLVPIIVCFVCLLLSFVVTLKLVRAKFSELTCMVSPMWILHVIKKKSV